MQGDTRRRRRRPARLLPAAAVILAGLCPPLADRAHAASPTAEEKRVDASVVRALKFLAQEQQRSGGWRLRSFRESTAATSLAVMAFLAAGHVPGEGPYGRPLENAVDWVLDHQVPIDGTKGRESVMLVNRASGDSGMYSHGISTLMLAEVVGMLKKDRARRCRGALEKAVRLILAAQGVRKSRRHAGGWRYKHTSVDSDLSVTGWQLLALRAAKDVGCDVPKENIDRAVAYVTSCRARRGSRFAYQPFHSASPTRTGTGILCLEVCGKHKSPDVVRAADALLRRPLHRRSSFFFYGVYYCTTGMFKVGGKHWEATKANTHALLLGSQRQDGSWIHGGRERRYGPIYCTSMAVLALSVEYRYLPIYQR
ncbi:MAG: prenyltransferase/squalene oxidase repeat-containing protein [Planctomycetaceae bacterium]